MNTDNKVKDPKLNLEDKLKILYDFSFIVEKHHKYLPIYEIMVTGFSIKENLPRKYIVDTLYYLRSKSIQISKENITTGYTKEELFNLNLFK